MLDVMTGLGIMISDEELDKHIISMLADDAATLMYTSGLRKPQSPRTATS